MPLEGWVQIALFLGHYEGYFWRQDPKRAPGDYEGKGKKSNWRAQQVFDEVLDARLKIYEDLLTCQNAFRSDTLSQGYGFLGVGKTLCLNFVTCFAQHSVS